ncbi:pseudouridine synthase [Streptococcus cameli]
MRLDQLLGKAGLGGRNAVKKLIRSRQVRVDGKVATKDSLIVDSGLQKITVSGQIIRGNSSAYFLLNKPAGVVTAVSDAKHQTVVDLLSEKDRQDGIYPVGRLDRDTEGLVILTTNGPLGFRMLHPRHHVSKTYLVEVNGQLKEDAPEFFAEGVVFLDGTSCQPAHLEIIETRPEKSSAYLTISEGKFHQVKKMFLAYGLKVTYLKRVAFGGFRLEETLPAGQYRKLTRAEEAHLKTYFD